MRFIYTLFIVCFLPLASLCQGQKTSIDSLKREFKFLDSKLVELKKSNDSLSKEFEKYKVKDEFYTSEFSALSTHFEWFVGVIVTVGGFIFWGFYKRDINKIESLLLNQKVELEELIKKEQVELRKLKYRYYRQSYGMMQSTAIYTRRKSVATIPLFFGALNNITRSYDYSTKENLESVKKSIKMALKNCSKVIHDFMNDVDPTGDKTSNNDVEVSLTALKYFKKFYKKLILIDDEEISSKTVLLVSQADKAIVRLEEMSK